MCVTGFYFQVPLGLNMSWVMSAAVLDSPFLLHPELGHLDSKLQWGGVVVDSIKQARTSV